MPTYVKSSPRSTPLPKVKYRQNKNISSNEGERRKVKRRKREKDRASVGRKREDLLGVLEAYLSFSYGGERAGERAFGVGYNKVGYKEILTTRALGLGGRYLWAQE